MAGVNRLRLNKTAKEIWDAYTSGTTVMLRNNSNVLSYSAFASVAMGTVTDGNGTEFTAYIFRDGSNVSYYAYGDNYYPVSDGSVAQDEAGFVAEETS